MTRFTARRHPLAAALLAASLASNALITLAAGQPDAVQSRVQAFSIPAGDLGTALNRPASPRRSIPPSPKAIARRA